MKHPRQRGQLHKRADAGSSGNYGIYYGQGIADRHAGVVSVYGATKDRRRTSDWLVYDLSALPNGGAYTLHIKAAREQTERAFALGVPRPGWLAPNRKFRFDCVLRFIPAAPATNSMR